MFVSRRDVYIFAIHQLLKSMQDECEYALDIGLKGKLVTTLYNKVL